MADLDFQYLPKPRFTKDTAEKTGKSEFTVQVAKDFLDSELAKYETWEELKLNFI